MMLNVENGSFRAASSLLCLKPLTEQWIRRGLLKKFFSLCWGKSSDVKGKSFRNKGVYFTLSLRAAVSHRQHLL